MSNQEMTIENVAEFLKTNPDFFEEYPDILLKLTVSHPHGEHTVSIPERQLIATREKVRLLESKLAELVGFAEDNDELSEKIHTLTLKLIASRSFEATLDTLYLDLLDNFQVPHIAVRLWGVAVPEASANAPEFREVTAEIKQFVSAMGDSYCGAHPVYESHLWFGEHAPHLKSFAMVPLNTEKNFGVLLMASENPERFYHDMGTQFLTRVGDLVAARLAQYLTFASEPAAA